MLETLASVSKYTCVVALQAHAFPMRCFKKLHQSAARKSWTRPAFLRMGLVEATLVFALASNSLAQEAEIRWQEGPYYVGEPVVCQVAVSADGSQDVVCEYGGETEPGLTITGPSVSQSRSVYSQYINGRFTQRESVEYRFSFQVSNTREGSQEIGPFVVSIDGNEQVVEGRTLSFEQLSPDPDMRLEVELDRQKFYVGERVPITFKWIFFGTDQEELPYVYDALRIRSPLFDQFEFIDQQSQRSSRLVMVSSSGPLEIAAEARRENIDGRQAVVISSVRTMVANSAGSYEDIVTTCRTDRVTSWQRGFFGDVSPRDRRPAIALSEPLSFTIKEIPTEGRPASFSGAVGNGFAIDVSANRSVVRVGDPISLNVSVSGSGNLKMLSFPKLTGPNGLNANQFQLPADDPPGTFAGNKKQFQVTLRITDEKVTQIPALPFSWFNPVEEKFETTYSKPIALQVRETELISSNSVVAAPKTSSPALKGSSSTEFQAGSNALSLVGANLAIERNTARLLASSTGWFSTRIGLITCYSLGLIAIGLAWLVRGIRSSDAQAIHRRQALKTRRKRIRAADKLPIRQAAELIATVLRETIADLSPSSRREAEALIAECETLIYAPSDSEDSQQVHQLVHRSLSTFDRLAKEA